MQKKLTYIFLIFSILIWIRPLAFSQDHDTENKKPLSEYEKAKRDLSIVLGDQGRLSNREKVNLCLRADSIFRKHKVWQSSIISLVLSTNFLQQEREYQKIDQLTKEAISIAQSNLTEDDYYFGIASNARGLSVYLNKNDYTNAIKLFSDALFADKKNNASLLGSSIIYFNLGICYQEIGDYDLAISQFSNALSIQFDSLNLNDKMIPNLLNRRGLCFINKKEYPAAIEDFKTGINHAKNITPQKREVDQVILYLYQNLAALYLETNQLELAQKYVSLALSFQKGKAFIKDAYTYELQGKIFSKEDKPEAALSAFQKSTTFAKLEFKDFEKHPLIGNTYFHTGNAWFTKNQSDSALYYYQLALVHNSINFNSKNPFQNPPLDDLISPLNAIDILEQKAKIFNQKYTESNTVEDLNYVFSNYALAIKAISKARQSFNAEGSKHTLAGKVIPVYEGAIESALRLFQTNGEIKWLEKGLLFAESNKAAALLESIQKNEALNTTGIPDSLLTLEYNLKVEIAFYEKLLHQTKQGKQGTTLSDIKDLKQRLFEFKESYRLLINQFESDYPAYFTLKFTPPQIKTTVVQQYLNNNALVEFFVGQKNIFIFTLTSKDIFCNKVEKSITFEEDIKNLIASVSKAPNSKTILTSLKDFSDLSNNLYKSLLNTSIGKLPSSTENLVIIPDDILAYLPFSVFIEKANTPQNTSYKNLAYLSNKFGISYNYSIALWMKQLSKKSALAKKHFLGFAPEFSTYKDDHQLSSLSCNNKEIEQISHLLNTADSRYNAEANLGFFKENAPDYQIIHLATHTSLDNQNSAFNRIYFSDNYLNQNDLYQLQLNAELAVLSACNTGSGELKKGEGVMSLSRGFIHAGCPSVLMSLWSVDDCTTADIMFNYYESLKKGETKDSSLKHAKGTYLDKTEDLLQAHPYYWAAFVQYGNTEPMAFSSFPWIVYGLGAGIFIFLIVVFIIKRGNTSS